MASRATQKLLRVMKTDAPGFERQFSEITDRLGETTSVEKEVRKIIERVRQGGDEALLALIRKTDGAKVEQLEVSREEWDDACESADAADRAALGKAAMRVREFHRKRIPSSWEMREEGGAFLGHKVRPLQRVGLFAAGGDRPAVSAVVMNTVPASAVEVPEIVLATPARSDGTIAPEMLTAARVSGVHRVFKMGGAHAIAALAYGTASVPAVDKIVGFGDATVSAAKRAVEGQVAVSGNGGPRELCIVADRSATPAWLAADLIAHAEQDEQARVLLVTHTKALVTRVQDQILKQLQRLEGAKVAREALSKHGTIVVTRNLQESITIANRYAPEHLVLAIEDPEPVVKGVANAGAVFLGHYTPVAAGDYLAGPNSVLPTGGRARFSSPLGVEDFLKRTSFVKFEPPKLRELGGEITRLAEVEGLSGHGASVDLRLQKIRRVRREREAAREAEL